MTVIEDLTNNLAMARAAGESMWEITKAQELIINTLEDRLASVTAATKTIYGPSYPAIGLTAIRSFETNSKTKMGLLRTYSVGKSMPTAGSLNQTDKAITNFPGRSIVFNPLTTGRGLTVAQYQEYAIQLQFRAAKVPRFILVPDAESDRQDRTYTISQFIETFDNWYKVKDLMPNVEISLNTTGYEFLKRIPLYDSIKGLYDILSIDPYWKTTVDNVQGSVKDILAARDWCKTNGKKLAFGEWGVEMGPKQPTMLAEAMQLIRFLNLEFSCYFDEDGAGMSTPPPIKTKLESGVAFSVYQAGALPL